jgi:NADH-quinone oxidoreductase subunit H
VLWFLGWSISSFGRDIILQATDIDVALLIFGVMSIGVTELWLVDGLLIINSHWLAVLLTNGILSCHGFQWLPYWWWPEPEFREISAQQVGMNWNVFYQPLSFLIFFNLLLQKQELLWFSRMRNRINWWIPYGIFFYENGFYLFAEYANMFISSYSVVLFLYNYPGMSWAVENWGKYCQYYRYRCFIYKNMWIYFTCG